MNLNLISGSIVSGMVLLTIGMMNRGVNYNSQDITLSSIKQEQKIELSEVLSHDLPKIGYTSDNSLDTLIAYADEKSIAYYSNIDNSADGSVELVTWELTNEADVSTDNPNDYKLVRTVGGTTTNISLGITTFTLNYYDKLGGTTPLTTPLSSADMDNVKQIEVVLVLESGESIQYSQNTGEKFVKSAWVKRFTPRNLKGNG